MHIVTKVLVVVAAVLSVLLAGLAISYASNADRLVAELKLERDKTAKAEAQASASTASAAAQVEDVMNKIKALESTNQTLTASLTNLQGDNARLLAEVNSLKQAALTHSAQIDQFTAVVQTYAALNKSQSDELNTLRQKDLAHARREIELTDRINDLTGEVDVSRETNRTLQEQLVDLRDQMDRGGLGGGTTGSSTSGGSSIAAAPSEQVFLRAPTSLRARVTSVRTDDAGNVIVSIDAGASDRLRERMKLNIVRDRFLATVVLERVDQNEAVGKVDFLGRKDIQIQNGDLVVPTL